MTETPDYIDKRQEVIDRMNAGRAGTNKPPLTPRQAHLVREFIDDDGVLADADRALFTELLRSNSV